LWTTDTANQPLALTTFGAYDSRGVLGTAPTDFASGSDVTIGGTVTTAATATSAAVAVAGTPVTFAGAGLQFKATVDSQTIWATGSITVYTDASGAFDVVVYSNKAGAQTVTATAGAATSKLTIDFADAANDTATTIGLVAPALVKAGRTLTIVGTLTDKYGNPVAVTDGTASASTATGHTGNNDFTVTYDGPGYVISTPTSTDATGKFTLRVLLGADEVGLATVTTSYDPDDAVADNTITKSATTLIGVSASVSAGKKVATAVVKNATGLTVKVVSGSKTVSKVATSDSFKVSLTKLTAGKKTVKVYVNDVLVSTKSVTVKK
jgi:adhesin/invasin